MVRRVATPFPCRPARLTGLLCACAALAVSCSGPEIGFDATRARAHIETLAGTIGSRPHGSPASALARDYVVDQLESLGFAVRIQETEAVHPGRGLTARVRNVIAWRAGELDTAIALVSHYDSRPEASGALDDALGVATSLEAARLLGAEPMRHGLFVLVTDAEEVGLMGARAIVTDQEVARRVRAFLNFDGTGAGGGSVLFETTGGAPLRAWATGAIAPDGGSFSTEIYRRMPNDTDFTVLRTIGAAGLNFAAVGDSYAYHTDRDVPSRVRTSTLRHATENAVTIIRALDAMELEPVDTTPSYFDLARTRGIVYGPVATNVVAIVACVVGAIVWVGLGSVGRRRRGMGVLGLLLTGAAGGLVAMAAGLGMMAAAWLVVTIRSEVVPWYAAPSPYFVFLATAGVLAGWSTAQLMGSLPRRVRLWRAPGAVWFTALPVWIVFAATLLVLAPAASYLVAFPLLVTSVTLLVSWRSAMWIRFASVVALSVAAIFWVANTARLLGFLVALLGWMPVTLPSWTYPAILGAAGAMLAPGVAAALIGRKFAVIRPSRVLVALFLPLVASGGLSLMTPAYTEHRPQRRAALYVQATGQARWEISGNEPAADLTDSLPGAAWGPVGSVAAPATRLAGLSGPFRVETASTALVDDQGLPAVVRAELLSRPDGGQEFVITIVPRALTAAQVRLPPGIVPLDSSLVGQIVGGRWTASYAAVPSAGLSVRLGLGAVTLGDLGRSVVVLTTARLPGGRPPTGLPAWLPTDSSTWSVRSVFVIPVVP